MKLQERKHKSSRRRLSCHSPSLRKSMRSSGEHSYDVFLGGSCNPTQWRKDTAMPALKKEEITFYNPQRADWRPELIEMEREAKEHAKVLFFVHDKETRSLASMVEAAEISGKRRPLVLAVEDQAPKVMNEPLTETELREMNKARNYMRDIAHFCNIQVQRDVESGIRHCIDGVRNPSILMQKEEKHARSSDCEALGKKFIELQANFNNFATNGGEGCANGQNIEERKLAFKALTNRELSKDFLLEDKPSITFDDYCCIVSEEKINNMEKASRPGTASSFFSSFFRSPSKCQQNEQRQMRDIFLGGPVGELDWRSQIAQPLLKKHHVSISLPVGYERFVPLEREYIERCRVLLFVFPSDCWGAAEMIVASYYIGAGYKVVLCIQNLMDGVVVNGEKLSKIQIKDYNRGRMYLSDQATRSGVSVFDDITEATEAAIEMAKEQQAQANKS